MQRKDYLWKGILEDILDDFLRFMHPDADKIFDFKRGITFLDKELEQLFPPEKDKFSVKIVDKLAKIYTHEGEEEWILVHCEVQGEYNVDFPLRMYTYHSRIFDKYRKRITAYAILTEAVRKNRPNRFVSEFLGTKITYDYNVYKISQQSEEELLKSENPFAMVALTVRSVLKTKRLDDAALMEIKLKLARQLFEKSYSKEKVQQIMVFLGSYINFENRENDIIFDTNLDEIKGRTKTMGIIEMVIEENRLQGMELGKKQGIEQGKKQGIERGMELGIEQGKREVVINLLQKEFTDDLIMDVTGVSAEYIQKIRLQSSTV